MSEAVRSHLVRWPLILVSCLMVFLIWPAVGFAYAMAAFDIKGDATGPISPGIRVPIELSFINRHPTPMTISRLRVSIQDLTTPAATLDRPCSLDDFELTQVAETAEWTVPAGTTLGLRQSGMPLTEWPQVAMRNRQVNQDGCKGATLTLGYKAHGVFGSLMLRTILKNAFLGLLLVLMTFSALGGIAAAVWSAVGSGSGAGGTGTTVAVTLTPGTPATSLYPGGQANVVLSVSNSNVATVRIGSLSLDTLRGTSGFSVDTPHAACGLSALTFTTQTNGTTGWTVPGKVGTVNGSLVITLTNAVSMSASAVSACQGATFTVFLIGAP